MNWYYRRGEAQTGPVSWEELVVTARAGGLGSGDLVWADGMAQWQAAATIPGLLPGVLPGPLPGQLPQQAPIAVPPARPAPAPSPERPGPARPAAYAAPPARPAYARPPARPSASNESGMLVPAGMSGWAMAAGYLGLLSVLGYPAILSLIVGMIALRDVRKHPEKQGVRRAWFAIIMGAVGTIVVVLLVGSTLIANMNPR